MKLPLYLYDDPGDADAFLPFSASRPLGELRHGASNLRQRLAGGLGEVTGYLVQGHMAGFVESGAPPALLAPTDEGPALILRSTFVPEEKDFATIRAEAGGKSKVGMHGVKFTDRSGATIGAAVPRLDRRGAAAFHSSWPVVQLKGARLEGVWRIIADLLPTLQADLAAERARRRAKGRTPPKCTVFGKPADLLVDAGAMIEPHVVFDTRNGPIWIQAKAEVRAFSRLAGPLVVGAGTRIVGGHVRESSIGPVCVVHGEVSNSVFLGYANKSHDGFLGHSIVGRWVNLGAGTITSNLKNTYGPVRLNLGAARVETGMTFLGAMIGDHAKTAIGTMLPTGCVIGAGANLFGSTRPGPLVPPFAWGTDETDRRLACRMFLQTAERVLPRRGVAFDAPMRAWLTALWQHSTGQLCD